MNTKWAIIQCDGFGDIINAATSRGFDDSENSDWTPAFADELEAAALEYLAERQVLVLQEQDDQLIALNWRQPS